MVSKLMSCSTLVARRKPSSARTTSISDRPPLGVWLSSQHRNSTIAAPSRRCASRMPCDFGGVLAGLGQAAGIIAPGHGDAGFGQFGGNRERGGAAIDPHRALQGAQGGHKGRDRAQQHIGAQMRAGGVVELRGIGKQGDMGVVMQDGKAVQHRVARHIGTADVQKPAQAVGQGDHRRRLACACKVCGQARALCRRWSRPQGCRDAQRQGPSGLRAGRARSGQSGWR